MSHLLRTNEPPSDEDASYPRLALADELEKLADIDARLETNRQEYDSLLRQRAAIRHCKADSYGITLHPTRRVPEDVLLDIFLLCINETIDAFNEESSLDPKGTMWAIPRVSRAWRAVALSFPRLWANIRIPASAFTSPGAFRIPNSLFLLAVQLNRSGTHPLSVTVTIDVGLGSSSLQQIPQIFYMIQALAATSERWRRLVVRLPLWSYEVLSTYITSLPLLTEAHVQVTSVDEGELTGGVMIVDAIKHCRCSKIFKSCLNLKTIHIHPRYLSVFELPFSNIETFVDTGDLSSTADCIAALRLLPRLRVFRIKLNGEEPEVVELLKLPYLENLSIQGSLRILDFLITPSLKNLQLDTDNNWFTLNQVCVEPLLAFLHLRSRCKINCLSLVDELSDTECIQILEEIPTLEVLALDCPRESTDRFLGRLTAPADDSHALLPLLKTLELKERMQGPFAGVDRLKEARPGLVLIIN